MAITAKMDAKRAVQRYRSLPKNVIDELMTTTLRLLLILQRHIQDDKLEGQVLKSHTHTLRNAIHTRGPQATATGVKGSVGLGEEAWYGKLHEFGGTFQVPAHIRRMFHYTASGKRTRKVTGQGQVRAHSITFPERSFMRSAAADLQPQIASELRQAVKRGIAKS